jgi:RHS repeat-associated protein
MRRALEMERLPNAATGFVGDRYWYQTDGLDSVVALTDESGDLASPFLYDEYGQLLAGTTELQMFAYTGQDYDVETGLYHFYARYYDARRGIWLTQDTHIHLAIYPQNLLRYSYVANNPIVAFDLYGFLSSEEKEAIQKLKTLIGENQQFRNKERKLKQQVSERVNWYQSPDEALTFIREMKETFRQMRMDDEQFIRDVKKEKNRWYYKVFGWLPKMKQARRDLETVISDTELRMERIDKQLRKLKKLKELFEDLENNQADRKTAREKFDQTRQKVDRIVKKTAENTMGRSGWCAAYVSDVHQEIYNTYYGNDAWKRGHAKDLSNSLSQHKVWHNKGNSVTERKNDNSWRDILEPGDILFIDPDDVTYGGAAATYGHVLTYVGDDTFADMGDAKIKHYNWLDSVVISSVARPLPQKIE